MTAAGMSLAKAFPGRKEDHMEISKGMTFNTHRKEAGP